MCRLSSSLVHLSVQISLACGWEEDIPQVIYIVPFQYAFCLLKRTTWSFIVFRFPHAFAGDPTFSLFFLPPYSPQLNIAETLWRILKGKWIRPQDYITSDMLFYTTNRALADIGKGGRINFSKHVA